MEVEVAIAFAHLPEDGVRAQLPAEVLVVVADDPFNDDVDQGIGESIFAEPRHVFAVKLDPALFRDYGSNAT